MTSGCYPLHPVTTALLSSVTLNTRVAEARSAVGFIRWALEKHGREPLLQDARVNWIRPTALVPFFRDMLGGVGEWQQFQTALGGVGNERTPLQEACLQAILLHDVAGLKPSRVDGFVPLVSILTGYEEAECQSALKGMEAAGYIRYDATGRRWVFLPPGESEEPVEEWLGRQTEGQSLDFATLQRLPEAWKSWHESPFHPLTGDKWKLQWGNDEDWAAQVFLLSRTELSAANLQKLIALPASDPYIGLKLPARGVVIHLMAAHDEDVGWLRQNAASLLDEALQGQTAPPPVILTLPREAQPALSRLLLRKLALDEMPDSDKRDFGTSTTQNVQTRYKTQVKGALEKRMAESADFMVPLPYRAKVEQAFTAAGARRLGDAVQSCYNEAYDQRPPELLKQYALAKASSYRKGIEWVAGKLVMDAVGSLSGELNDRRTPPPGKDLVFSGSRPLVATWHLLASEGYGIQVPTGSAAQGWKVLDDAFAEGKGAQVLADIFVTLLAPPYGYDAASLTLLLCAWYGRNRHLLSVTAGNAPVAMDRLWVYLDKPWEFLCQLSKQRVAWARRDANAEARRAGENIALVQKNQPLERERAEEIEAQLRGFGNDEHETDVALREQARGIADRLSRDLESSQKYDELAGQIEEKLLSARRSKDLITAMAQIGALPQTGLVPATRPLPAQLTENAAQRLTFQVEADCAKWEKLAQLTDFRHHEQQLREIERELRDLPLHLPRVESAKQKLKSGRDELEADNHDRALIGEMRGMEQITALSALRNARARLDAMAPLGEGTKQGLETARQELEKRAQELEECANGLSDQASQLTTAESVAELRDQINARALLFEGTPEADLLKAALKQVGALTAVFGALGELQRDALPALNAGPTAVAEWQARSGKREAEMTRSEVSSAAARNGLASLRREMAQGVQTAQQRAAQWLAQQKEAVQSGEASTPARRTLRQTLFQAPVWLSESERAELENLREQVQASLERDEVGAIVERFRTISDPAQRALCLQQLQALQIELEAAR